MNKYNKRTFVVYRNKQLMPMRLGRAKKYVRLEKAVFRVHRKLGVRYLELLAKPIEKKTQPIRLGFDDGSVFDGFSVVSQYCHHENFELIHNKKIKKRMDVRRQNRRTRRGRLRNRPSRFSWRTKDKMVPTIRSMFNFRVDLFNKLSELVPISEVIWEKNSFNFWKKNYGKFATQAMQGVSKFIEYIESRGILCTSKKGYETKRQRIALFGSDLKTKTKDAKSFFAHGVDSYALASMPLVNGIELTKYINKKTRFITKIWFVRRQLHQEKKKFSTKHKPNQHLYRKYKKGGVIEYLDPYYGKRKIIRTAKYEGSFRAFDILDQGKDLKYHKFRKKYGGTVYYGISKWSVWKSKITSEVILPISEALCKKLANNRGEYRMIGYKRWNIEVTYE